MIHARWVPKDLESRMAKLEVDKQHSNVVMVIIGKELDKLKKFKEEYEAAMD